MNGKLLHPITKVLSKTLAAYVLIFTVGLLFVFHSTLFSGFDRMPGELFDYRLNQYFLEHSWKMASNHSYSGQLYGPTFFTPYPNALAFSDNLFGAAPIYWIFRVFLAPDISFMGWIIVLSLLNFMSMVFVLRKEEVQPGLAGLGGFLFAFPLHRIAQYAHVQLFPQFCTPICLWLAWRFFIKPSKLKWLFILITLYWQILCGIYLGWFLLLVLLIFTITVSLILPESRQKITVFFRNYWRFSSLSLGAWMLLLYNLFQPYLDIKRVMGGNSYSLIVNLLPKPMSWLIVPSVGSLWSPILAPLHQFLGANNPVWEQYNFLGSVLMTLTILTVYSFLMRKSAVLGNQKKLITAFTLTGLLVAFCATDFGQGVSVWWLIYHVIPGASVIRAPSRIFLAILPCLIISGIVFLSECFKFFRLSKSVTKYLIPCIIVLAMFEQRITPPTYDASAVKRKETELSQLMKQYYCQVAYVTPFKQLNEEVSAVNVIESQINAMWAGIDVNVPVINGYSGYAPPKFSLIWRDKEPILAWLLANGSQPIDRLCFMSQYSPKIEPDIKISETYKSGNYFVEVIRYPQTP
jgi:hypothetical protein